MDKRDWGGGELFCVQRNISLNNGKGIWDFFMQVFLSSYTQASKVHFEDRHYTWSYNRYCRDHPWESRTENQWFKTKT